MSNHIRTYDDPRVMSAYVALMGEEPSASDCPRDHDPAYDGTRCRCCDPVGYVREASHRG